MDNAELIEKARQTHCLTRDEIVRLLATGGDVKWLLAAADAVRHEFVGDEVHLRGLIEFSNICKRNCFYCGLRCANKNVERYRLSLTEVVDFAVKARGYGYKTVVMQSGEDEHFAVDDMVEIIKAVKKLGLTITLSIGEKSADEYAAYKRAGADRYLLRIETTNQALYAKLHPGMELENRKRCLNDLKRLGYEVGTGSLIGLPGQTLEMLADDLLFFKELDADMIGTGPFIPNDDTPLKGAAAGDLGLTLRFVALVRLLLPEANIPATTALETLHPNARLMGLQAGANVIMPNVTEGDYRRKYQLYPGKIAVKDTPLACLEFVKEKIAGIGRTVSQGHGYRRRNG